MGLLDFNPNDAATIQRQLRERGDDLSGRAATTIEDLRTQLAALQDHRAQIRRQIEPWAMVTHRMVQVVRAYLVNKRLHIPRTYREAMTYLCDTADKAVARAQASPDALLPPAPPRVSMYHVPSADWRAKRGRRAKGTGR
jgi:hypothetical protein